MELGLKLKERAKYSASNLDSQIAHFQNREQLNHFLSQEESIHSDN